MNSDLVVFFFSFNDKWNGYFFKNIFIPVTHHFIFFRSVDGILNPTIKNSHVPKWNYVLLRFQVNQFFFITLVLIIITYLSYTMCSLSPTCSLAKPLTAKHQMRMYILHTVLYRYPKVLTRRIYLTPESPFNGWSFPLFCWL